MIKKFLHERRNTNDAPRVRAWLKGCAILLTFAAIILGGSRYYAIEISATNSALYHVFWLQRGKLPKKSGWVSFLAPENGVYPKNTIFTKQVLGVTGDRVTESGRQFFVNGEFICFAKRHRKTGEPLELGPTGIIPQGQYFVHAPHQDSFDSRYQNMGWIRENQILGTATPLF